MNPNNIPNPQQSPGEKRQRYVIKTKTIGSTSGEIPEDVRQKIKEKQSSNNEQKKNSDHQQQQAEKIKAEILKRVGKMRHLKFDVIKEAAIVQVSVIDTEDGNIVRKVPSDEMVELVLKLRKTLKTSSAGLDVKA